MESWNGVERAISGLFLKSTKSFKDVNAQGNGEAAKEYPADASAYEILEDCGRGVSATVYRAYCRPRDEVVAIKKMNLESVHSNLDEIVHEAQLMKNYNHPQVLPLHTSFVDGSDLWMVMPFISGGSVLHIMKYAYPEGLEELVISTIMRDVLKGLDYVHRQGGIHRDIKAGNILVNLDGSVKLADFGVATSMDRTGSWGHDKAMRMTFVGTPCWMAPEVMEQTAGYDNAADIWSFGIAMLEMAHGHAPFAKYPPMKVLLMTLQNPPPSLEDKGKKHFSKAMRDVVTRCLQKDPRNRPAASQLLEHKFFKQAKDEDYLTKYLIGGLPSLGDRVQEIRQGKAATLGSDNERNFARSQQEYMKGVSSWNFDIAALKAAADLEPDEDAGPMLPTIKEYEEDMTLSGPERAAAADMAAALKASGATPASASASSAVPSSPVGAKPALSVSAAPAASNEPSSFSAFATSRGQAATASVVGLSTLVVEAPASAGPATAGGNGNGAAEPPVTAAPAEPLLSPVGIRSPTNGSGMSRESSQGLGLQSLTSNSKLKTKGRFTVHDDGEMQPLSASASSVQLAARDAEAPAALTTRDSEDGFRKEERAVTFAEAVIQGVPTEDSSSTEPKKKGRFTVIENNPSAPTLEHKPSQVNLQESLREPLKGPGVEAGVRESSGKPQVGLAAALVPKLQELLDHAARQQAALSKLVAAVSESERSGRPPASLRASLFEPCESDSVEELRAVVEQLQHRLGAVEAENARLRLRNGQLEGHTEPTPAGDV